ncbi:MAG: hypothetical protein K9M17_07355 [Mariprofundaceae bacterium]|nr:hypothetical protein [Mariprofundaceae bacterium]
MNLFRAKRIADAFSQIGGFRVENQNGAICVDYLGNRARFFHEASFWSFVFCLARASHEEGPVARIESELVA